MKGEKKIRKIITAIGTNELNLRIREKNDYKFYEVIGNDIPYQEGVLDILKGNFEINTLILSESLPGEFDDKKFIKEIKRINPCLEIMYFLKDENNSLRNFLLENDVKKIFIDGENTIDEICNSIKNDKNENNLNLEIEFLKKFIEEKNVSLNTDEFVHKLKIEKTAKEKILKTPKVIGITGYFGCGKTLFTAMLAKSASKMNLKTIIVDFDILNNSINNLFNISKYNRNVKFSSILEQHIVKINNINIFTGIDELFNEKNKINFEKIKELLEKLKEKYDLILFDTSSETNLKYVKTLLVNIERIIFLVEPNLIEIKKSKELLEVYINDWEIPQYKFNLVLNKVNINSIDDEIISNLFDKIKIIGKINLSKKYTVLANNANLNIIDIKEYKNILRKIG